ncbi:MAG: MnhB domain-containing protein [Lachnospiraceae bacterium]|nr:MnhB domain-containing protein [Lachnospiraceae bacterium]
MSKMRDQKDYEKTASFHFWRWLSGEKDFYVGQLEMQKQEEFKESEEAVKERENDHARLHDKVYDLDHNKEIRGFRIFYRISAVILCLLIAAALILCVSYLPQTGNPDNPSVNEVAKRYVEQGMAETGVINTVTGMILNYRGFDTFGETCVLFIASSCVMILLMANEEKLKHLPKNLEPKDDKILQYVARIIVPLLMIFGLYVIFNGHLSPGGGFSGGAIIGSGLILYSSAFGAEKIRRFFNEKVYKCIKITALILYGCTMSYYFYTGANGIPNIFPLGIPGDLVSAGMIIYINLFVGSEVACTVYSFYALFKRGGL